MSVRLTRLPPFAEPRSAAPGASQPAGQQAPVSGQPPWTRELPTQVRHAGEAPAKTGPASGCSSQPEGCAGAVKARHDLRKVFFWGVLGQRRMVSVQKAPPQLRLKVHAAGEGAPATAASPRARRPSWVAPPREVPDLRSKKGKPWNFMRESLDGGQQSVARHARRVWRAKAREATRQLGTASADRLHAPAPRDESRDVRGLTGSPARRTPVPQGGKRVDSAHAHLEECAGFSGASQRSGQPMRAALPLRRPWAGANPTLRTRRRSSVSSCSTPARPAERARSCS